MTRIVQIAAAAAGWRVVYVLEGFEGDTEDPDVKDEEIMRVKPIACFALVEPDHRAETWPVVAVTPQDWPEYLYEEADDDVFAYLGPGEEITDFHRTEALLAIERYRAKQAAEEPAR